LGLDAPGDCERQCVRGAVQLVDLVGDLLDNVGHPVGERLVVLADLGSAQPLCDQ